MLRCLRPLTEQDVEKSVVRAQYIDGELNGDAVPGYRKEVREYFTKLGKSLPSDSTTETFWSFDDPQTVAIKMFYVQRRVPGGLGGAFLWAFKDDDSKGTLAKTMARGLGK